MLYGAKMVKSLFDRSSIWVFMHNYLGLDSIVMVGGHHS